MIDKITVRPLKIDDLEEIIRVENGAWEPELRASEETIKNRFEENPAGFIGYFEDEGMGDVLKGFVYFKRVNKYRHVKTWKQATQEPLAEDGTAAYIVNVSVHPKGQGTGTRMLPQVHSILKSRGIEYVALGSREMTERFYKRCGYTVYARLTDWWPEDEASAGKGILMECELKKVYR